MSRGLENFTPFIESATGDYPWGNVKDGTGIGDGTDVNKLNHSDYHQTFRRLLSLAAINPNGLQDNVTNGYQYIQALDNLYKSFNGAIYTAVGLTLTYLHKRKIIVAQSTTTNIQIFLPPSTQLVNGETITILNNGNLPVTVSAILPDSINVFGVNSADINMYQKGDFIQLALDTSIGSWVIVNYKITPLVTPIAFTPITPNANFTVQNPYNGTSDPNLFQYRKNANNEIEFRGMVRIVSTTGSLVIMNLPAGSRPSYGVYRPVWSDYTTSNVTIMVNPAGNVNLFFASAISNGTTISLDGVRFSLDV